MNRGAGDGEACRSAVLNGEIEEVDDERLLQTAVVDDVDVLLVGGGLLGEIHENAFGEVHDQIIPSVNAHDLFHFAKGAGRQTTVATLTSEQIGTFQLGAIDRDPLPKFVHPCHRIAIFTKPKKIIKGAY